MVSNSSFHGYPAVTRSGRVDVKKAGLGLNWKGWKERWLVLKSKNLIAYKDPTEVEISFYIPLNTLKRLEHRGQRCVLLVTRGSSQYYLSFESNSQLVGWCSDIQDLSSSGFPEELFPTPSEDLGDNLVDEIIEEYSSPASESSLDTTYPWDTNPKPQLMEEVPVKQMKLQFDQRILIRKAISILCHSMEPRLLRISDPGGTKAFDLVELRLRSLLRLKRRWKKQATPDELDTEEMHAFSEALADGYVLCQLFNTLHSSSIIRPDPRDTVNVAKFRSQCVDCGLPPKDLFFSGDIEEATAESLTRVAQTITTLVKVVGDASSRIATRNALVKYSDYDDSYGSPGADISIVEIWVDKFIATRLDKQSLRFDPDSEFAPASGIHRISMKGKATDAAMKPKIYQNLFGLVADIAAQSTSRQSISLKRALDNLYRFMSCLDSISSLVESRQYRLRLLQVSAELKLKPVENRRLRDALRKDDEHIEELLATALKTDGCGEVILGLQGEDAKNCVDLIQDVG
ncbi:hypothetical protein L218DRAFT_424409 [Marasmius fiardii PR-910]|nr:hypothetical protein L218DRAFT_424409 [Marasmius fiardii PR-910]